MLAALHTPLLMIGSDSLALATGQGGKPHPRTYGTFPRVLGKYVREERLLSLEEGVRKMTSMAADAFGLGDRGVLAEGKAADIAIFDAETVADRASFDEPHPIFQRYRLRDCQRTGCRRSRCSASGTAGSGLAEITGGRDVLDPPWLIPWLRRWDLLPQVRAVRDELEELRHMPSALARAIGDAGLFQLYLPSAIGGAGTPAADDVPGH